MKVTTIKVLQELLKNSKQSDREIAKKVGVSQPTVSRKRDRMIKRKIILGYTAIPNPSKLGFEIEAYSIIPNNPLFTADLRRDKRVIYAKRVGGIIYTEEVGAVERLLIISIHKNYTDYATFAHKYRVEKRFLALTVTKPIKSFSLGNIELEK